MKKKKTKQKLTTVREREKYLLNGVYSPKRKELIMKKPASLTVGQRIRRERYLRKWSQEQLASYLDISTSYLGALERGERTITLSISQKLHRLFGISYDFLLDGISISGEAITQYVHESADIGVRHSIDVLLGVCTQEELDNCYELMHTYLANSRRNMLRPESPRIPAGTVRETSPLPELTQPGDLPGFTTDPGLPPEEV